VLELDAEFLLHHHGGDVIGAANAGIGDGQFAGIGLRIGDQFRHGLDRDRFMHGQHIGAEHHHGDGGEVLLEIIGQVRKQAGCGRHRTDIGQQQSRAVRRRLGDGVGAEIAGCAGLVLDHHALADRGRQFWADQPRQNVRRSAGRERHDDAHRPLEVLGEGGAGQLAEQDGCGGGKGGAAPETWKHCFSSGRNCTSARRRRASRSLAALVAR